MARSNLVTYAFLWEKVKTVDFSETIAACDLKVGRCRQLSITGQNEPPKSIYFFVIFCIRIFKHILNHMIKEITSMPMPQRLSFIA